VAHALHEIGIGTLLFDLLTEDEAADRANVFDITLLARRLRMAAEWVGRQKLAATLPLGFFGASTGAAAALVAAAQSPHSVRAIVSRGGRPDMAGRALPKVKAATLLIVGGNDPEVLALNRRALAELTCENALKVVPGATHLFEEAGALDEVVALAGAWFSAHLVPSGQQ
jgi:dienelactone hydrolase